MLLFIGGDRFEDALFAGTLGRRDGRKFEGV
jgi:hypothetical protein